MNNEAKPWYTSKTVLVNGGGLLVAAATMLLQLIQTGALPAILSPYTAILVLAANLILRFLTDRPIDLSPLKPKDKGDDDNAAGGLVPKAPTGPFNPDAYLERDKYQLPDERTLVPGTLPYVGEKLRHPGGSRVDSPSMTPLTIIFLLGFILAFAAIAKAEAPQAVIRGPEASIEVGDIVPFSALQSAGTPTHYDWEISPRVGNRVQLRSSGTGSLDLQTCPEVLVAPIPGRYLLRLTVSNADGSSTVFRDVVIPGQTPMPTPRPVPEPIPTPTPPNPPQPQPGPPGPAPAPTPDPLPVLPAGRFGFATVAYRAALTVDSKTRVSECRSLAGALRGIGAAIAAGTLDNLQEIVNQLGQALDKHTSAAWTKQREQLYEGLEKLYLAGKLQTKDDLRDLLLEAATGLEAVK